MAIKIKSKPKRRAGQRAGLTREIIARAALTLWASDPAKLSLRQIAKQLNVGPTTIHAHFPGGSADLQREIAREALGKLTPPYQPKQDPADYLRAFIHNTIAAFLKHPHVGRLVALEACNDPLLSLVFAERMAATIKAIAPDAEVLGGLLMIVARVAGLALIESGAFATGDPKATGDAIRSRVQGVPALEYPTLHQAAMMLESELAGRGRPSHLADIADATAAAIVADLTRAAAVSKATSPPETSDAVAG